MFCLIKPFFKGKGGASCPFMGAKMNRLLLLLVMSLSTAGFICAAPYTPTNPEFVVSESKRLTPENEIQFGKKFTNNGLKSTNDRKWAVDLARKYIALGKEKKDPRYYGIAEGILRPWWNSDDTEVNLLKAHLLQFNHQFNQSTTLLSSILKVNPRNVQALLLRVNNNMTQGKFRQAQADCQALFALTSPVLSATCLVSVKALQSAPYEANKLAENLIQLMNRANYTKSVHAWMLSVVMEIKFLHKQWDDLQQLFSMAEKNRYTNDYILAIYTDYLLSQKEYEQVIDLTEQRAAAFDLQIKRLIAMKQLGYGDYQTAKHKLEEILLNETRRGNVHYYENAMLELYLNKNPKNALVLAEKNWQSQKTMRDAALLYRCAIQAGDKAVLQRLIDWKKKNAIAIDLSQLVA